MGSGVTVLLIVNAIVGVASIGFATIAAIGPAVMSHSARPTSGERFYALMYAAKGVPLGSLAVVVPLISAGTAAVFCLVAAATSQVADAGIGLVRREWAMVGGGMVAALVHTVAAVAIR